MLWEPIYKIEERKGTREGRFPSDSGPARAALNWPLQFVFYFMDGFQVYHHKEGCLDGRYSNI
jgi:hypothetical protein